MGRKHETKQQRKRRQQQEKKSTCQIDALVNFAVPDFPRDDCNKSEEVD
ncbi:MAG: hypothetical protein OEL87_00015 [Nanoarchaeota archaeon]|nr:hypothetical protein [Nanoarchaeota archaeon]